MGLRTTIINALGGVDKTANAYQRSTPATDFLKYGNRSEPLFPDWSEVKMSDDDLYRGYSYAVIQKRGNKVASLAKENLLTTAAPEVVDEFQKAEQQVVHPYLSVIQNSTKFSEKQFWKDISIYLDLAGRYYLGVVRKVITPKDPSLPPIVTDVKEFIRLNPYEIRRVINKDGLLAGYIERKKDGRYREWPIDQIIVMKELNPFDPDNSQWAMTDAAKDAVYTINQSSDYTRQSLHGNLDAPGIITTDVLLDDEDFANFRARVQQHTKGEPLFGNGAGAIKWDSMQIDLDKAALLDINEINRTTLFAVSGTSKTSLGIEQSGTTRETARVQSEQFISDTAQPRLEDIIDFLNLDYKRHYTREYEKTKYKIEIKSAVGRDYNTENQATSMRQAQADLAISLIESGYTMESAYQYAEGNIELADLELKDGLDEPQRPQGGNEGGSEPEPEEPNGPQTEQSNSVPKEQGWVGAKVEPIKVNDYLSAGLKAQLYEGDIDLERTNIPAENHPHFTVVYGLTPEGINADWDDMAYNYLPSEVAVQSIDTFDLDADYDVVVAKLQMTDELEKMREAYMSQDHYKQEFSDYTPHVSLCYVNKNADKAGFINAFADLVGRNLKVTGYEVADPWGDHSADETLNSIQHENGCTCKECNGGIETYHNDITAQDVKVLSAEYDALLESIRSVQKDAINCAIDKLTVNAFTQNDIIGEEDKKSLEERLVNAFRKYWWILLPLFANNLTEQRNREFNKDTRFVFTNELQNNVVSNAEEVAEGHLETILKDILDAGNSAYTKVVEKVAAQLIISAYQKNPARFERYFKKEPTERTAIRAIRKTDILEENQKIYQRANEMALEGYDRQSIIKQIRAEYTHLSKQRATTIARNETSRAFTQSQYQADLQFLTNINRLGNAYKQLYSRSGNPCRYCQALIDKGPIPFTQNFLDKGDELQVTENGKTSTFVANYEDIQGGTVHVNCNCSYKLVFKGKDGKITSGLNSVWSESDDNSSTNSGRWLSSHSNYGAKEVNITDARGHEHASPGTPEGGQFVTKGGGAVKGTEATQSDEKEVIEERYES